MLLNSMIRAVVIILCIIALLSLITCNFLGPGISDYEHSIAGGYSYSHAGHYEAVIIYTGNDKEKEKKIIIDAKVLKYVIDENKIKVVRQPREIFFEGDVANSRLVQNCEYWEIDLSNKIATKIKEIGCTEMVFPETVNEVKVSN